MIVRASTRFVAAATFVLLLAGALVTSTESGLAVPDWPLSYGQLMPPMVGGILYEHGHRMIAAAVSTLVGLQVAVLYFFAKDRGLMKLGALAFGAILCQAVLGGLTVIFLLPPAISSAHAGLAQIVFALVASIALLASPRVADRSLFDATGVARLADELVAARMLTILAAAVTYVQILLGAVMRHTSAGLAIPDIPLTFGRLVPTQAQFGLPGVPIHFAHRLGAVLASVVIVLAIRKLVALRAVSPFFPRLAAFWGAVLVSQIGLGLLSVYSRKSVPITVLHLGFGALLWVSGVLGAVAISRARVGVRTRENAPAAPSLAYSGGSR